eukprot:evm.model.scf_5142.1 EVM.evm.TU.scf_5142.1   scf_5142:869-2982(-)
MPAPSKFGSTDGFRQRLRLATGYDRIRPAPAPVTVGRQTDYRGGRLTELFFQYERPDTVVRGLALTHEDRQIRPLVLHTNASWTKAETPFGIGGPMYLRSVGNDLFEAGFDVISFDHGSNGHIETALNGYTLLTAGVQTFGLWSRSACDAVAYLESQGRSYNLITVYGLSRGSHTATFMRSLCDRIDLAFGDDTWSPHGYVDAYWRSDAPFVHELKYGSWFWFGTALVGHVSARDFLMTPAKDGAEVVLFMHRHDFDRNRPAIERSFAIEDEPTSTPARIALKRVDGHKPENEAIADILNAVIGYGIGVQGIDDPAGRYMSKLSERPLVTDNPTDSEFLWHKQLHKSVRDDFLGFVRKHAASAEQNDPNRFRALLDSAYAFTALGTPRRTVTSDATLWFETYRLDRHRFAYDIGGGSVEWTVRHYRRPEDHDKTATGDRAILFVPGAKAEMGSMLARRSPDFTNLIAAHAGESADIWIVEPVRSIRAAAEANAKLSMLGFQMEGLRARAACDMAAELGRQYQEVFLYGIRDGGRTVEIVNTLCDTAFARVAVDALPVPLDLHLTRQYLSLTATEVGLLQTVGPFWGRHNWTDFPASAQNPTVYFLGAADLAAARAWSSAAPSVEMPFVTFVAKDAEFGGAEYQMISRFLSGEPMGHPTVEATIDR